MYMNFLLEHPPPWLSQADENRFSFKEHNLSLELNSRNPMTLAASDILLTLQFVR